MRKTGQIWKRGRIWTLKIEPSMLSTRTIYRSFCTLLTYLSNSYYEFLARIQLQPMQPSRPEPAVQAGAIVTPAHLSPVASAFRVAGRLVGGSRGLLEGLAAEAHVSILKGEEVIAGVQARPATPLD